MLHSGWLGADRADDQATIRAGRRPEQARVSICTRVEHASSTSHRPLMRGPGGASRCLGDAPRDHPAGLAAAEVSYPGRVRLVVARCSVDYTGRLTAHLPLAPRLLIVKADGSVLVHSDGGSYKPLNWMTPPCTLTTSRRGDEEASEDPEGEWIEQWDVVHDKTGDRLRVRLVEVFEDSSHDLGVDPGLQKDGVEAHLQALLAENIDTLGEGWSLVRREYFT